MIQESPVLFNTHICVSSTPNDGICMKEPPVIPIFLMFYLKMGEFDCKDMMLLQIKF